MAAPTGYSSLGLIGFTDKGDYVAATTYVQNDLCHYNGKIWKSKVDDNTGHTPASGSYWDIWVDPSDSLEEMTDVDISSPANGDVLEYDSTSGKWKNSDVIGDVKQALADEVEVRAKYTVHNLMPFDLATIKALNTSGTWNDNVYSIGSSPNILTFTVNPDLSITVNGANGSSADVYLYLTSPNSYIARDWGGKKLSGSTGGSNTTHGLYITASTNGTQWAADILQYDDEITIPNHPYYGSARIIIRKNAVMSNVILKPMICDAKDTCKDFTPPAMTNRELTEIALGESYDWLTNVKLYKRGNVVFCSTSGSDITVSAIKAAIIPTEFRPINSVIVAPYIKSGSSRYLGFMTIGSYGTVGTVGAVSNGSYTDASDSDTVQFSTCWITA